MDTQKRVVRGRPEVDQSMVDLANRITRLGEECERVVEEVNARVRQREHTLAQLAEDRRQARTPSDIATYQKVYDDALTRSRRAAPSEWSRRGKERLQEGLMFLRRSVAAPDNF
jgi:hypothetical protein